MKPQPSLRGCLRHLVISTILSYAIACFIFPEMFIYHSISFLNFSDYEFNYAGVFTLLSNFYHGGIQLWNPYDQMPLAYYHLTGGLYTYSNVVTAVAHVIVGAFTSSSEAFHRTFSIVFFGTSIIVRCAGFYLLLGRFTKEKWILFAGTFLGSTLFSIPMYMGLNCVSLYSLFPLLIHFSLRFFERGEVEDIFLALLVFVLGVSFDPMVGVGYFYQGVHLFLLSALAWCVVAQRKQISQVRLGDFMREMRRRRTWAFALTACGLCAIMILPSVVMLIAEYKSYDFAAESSRLNNVFSVTEYFKRPVFFAPRIELFFRTFDFQHNLWYGSWVFLGFPAIFLALCGGVLSRDSRKWVFIIAIALMWLINSDRSMFNVAHWLNALTNPFKFVPRSFHMTGAFLMPYVILPLTVMGMDRLLVMTKEKVSTDIIRRSAGVVLISLILVVFTWMRVEQPVRIYLFFSFLTLSGLLAILCISMQRRWARIFALACCLWFATDIILARQYYMRDFVGANTLAPEPIKGVGNSPLVFDWQNPKLLPWNIWFRTTPVGQIRSYVGTDPVNMQGLLFRYTNFNKYFEPATNYKPRHRAYSVLASDLELRQYLKESQELFRFAPSVAIDVKEPLALPGPVEVESRTDLFVRTKAKTQSHRSMTIVTWPIPPAFPAYLASTIFTGLSPFELTIDGKILSEVQGHFSQPFQFDVQNFEKGKVAISIPQPFSFERAELKWSLPRTRVVPEVYQPDRMVLSVDAPREGWLLAHIPFDPRWEAQVNGQAVSPVAANRAFLGVPVKAGINTVEIRYWPGSPLRILIPISILVSFGCLVYVIIKGNRKQLAEPK